MEKPVEQEQSGFRLPFVMKLFDRSVDLAQFSEQTPLYPICRAWIANQPHQMLTYNNFVKKRSQSPCPKEDPEPVVLGDNDSDICKDVYRLPLPNTPIYGNNKIRVPEITKYHSRFNKMDQDGIEPPTREQLLQDNLSHWTNVRQSWLDACAKNEARYKQSFRVLLAIFNK
ncbi:hypothetical protein AAG570_000471 [Ranatra chinensis]|uniref:Antolefinin n=1 Tax=Ranatra chinensis TaxID=642074 RepID=A0ABD0YXV4_9HEMI